MVFAVHGGSQHERLPTLNCGISTSARVFISHPCPRVLAQASVSGSDGCCYAVCPVGQEVHPGVRLRSSCTAPFPAERRRFMNIRKLRGVWLYLSVHGSVLKVVCSLVKVSCRHVLDINFVINKSGNFHIRCSEKKSKKNPAASLTLLMDEVGLGFVG